MGATLIIILVGAGLAVSALYYVARRKYHGHLARTFPQPAGPPVTRKGGSVIAYHPEVREIGEAVLRAGGNAFDAFVAAVAAENVMAEGASSLAGSLGVLLYRAEGGEVAYLDADFNDTLDPEARAKPDDPKDGKAVLVPGAPAGLEALAAKYGRLPLAESLAPAVRLAEEGFRVNRLMELSIPLCAKILKKSEYGRRTFFPGGDAPKVGDIIRQPEVAEFLRRLGKEGSAYVYRGEWGDRFLSVVEAHGGRLTAADLAAYSARWCAPWTTTYRGHTIHSSSGNSYGGPWVMLALKTLENAALPREPRYWEEADLLEQMIRVSHQVWSEPALFDYRALGDPGAIQSLLTAGHAASVWERVINKAKPDFTGRAGSHSYHIIVTDDEGNVASGTTTINSGPWGDGLFVEGIPLPAAGRIPWHTEPGLRRLGPFSIHFVLRDGRPLIAAGAISNSLVEAEFQFLVKLIDYEMSVEDAVSSPRFGTFPAFEKSKALFAESDRNWLDPRVERGIVKELKSRGLKLEQKGFVDTGLGAVARLGPDGQVEGITAPLNYYDRPFDF